MENLEKKTFISITKHKNFQNYEIRQQILNEEDHVKYILGLVRNGYFIILDFPSSSRGTGKIFYNISEYVKNYNNNKNPDLEKLQKKINQIENE
tara:strand:- start:2518 stop:2799 length:282 start_codon:yes stop_codon:yes gene_type:complete